MLIRIVLFFTFSAFMVLPALQCGGVDQDNGSVTKIRVINGSGHSFDQVSIFSMRLPNLNPNDTTEYIELDFDPLTDDPLIYAVSEGKNLGRYVEIPEKGVKRASYIIQGLNDGILYVDYQVEDEN